mmetsp:Transcript_6883/g.20733  ORF Transcript_6883/g.20733 Transcript_6883/m.20733 type:complete len:289 (+) Transcript_6883:23-889(+)
MSGRMLPLAALGEALALRVNAAETVMSAPAAAVSPPAGARAPGLLAAQERDGDRRVVDPADGLQKAIVRVGHPRAVGRVDAGAGVCPGAQPPRWPLHREDEGKCRVDDGRPVGGMTARPGVARVCLGAELVHRKAKHAHRRGDILYAPQRRLDVRQRDVQQPLRPHQQTPRGKHQPPDERLVALGALAGALSGQAAAPRAHQREVEDDGIEAAGHQPRRRAGLEVRHVHVEDGRSAAGPQRGNVLSRTRVHRRHAFRRVVRGRHQPPAEALHVVARHRPGEGKVALAQ